MAGQGSPQFDRPTAASRRLALATVALALACFSALAPRVTQAEDLDVRLRIAWGGGEASVWQGSIRLSAGTLSEVTPLGLEADDPGSMHLVTDAAGQSLRIHPRTPRTYDGCDVRIQAPSDAALIVEFASPAAPPNQSEQPEIPLAQIVKELAQFPLDARNNRLLVERSPGDALRVKLPQDHLVFSPSENLELDVLLNPADIAPGTYLLAASLLTARSDEQLWNEDQELKQGDDESSAQADLKIPLPVTEGVYDVRLALYPKRLTTSLVRGKPIHSRKVQVVVVAPVKPVTQAGAEWQVEYEFDPASPNWWERVKRLPSSLRLPSLPPPPVGSGLVKTRQHLGKAWVELPPLAWQAYPLSVSTPGQPHILEIEYPSDLPQTLGISIVEPNAAGQVGPIGLDSGIDVFPPGPGHEAGVRRHKLTFWPHTASPVVLLVNRRAGDAAWYGRVQLKAGPAELPPLVIPPQRHATRTLAASYEKPLFVENFSATEALDPATARSLDDWQTFLTAGQRLVETLQHTGRNAAVIAVACEGSALYPSDLLQPTPKYDSGSFFESGQDPVRKDVLELLFRLFDRAGIQLVPAVQFSAPLPALEAIRLGETAATVGLEPVGPDGRTWLARNGARRGMGVYYNALDERVQRAMIDVVRELGERYGHHPSFAGVAVQLAPESYSLLPDETASYDDATWAAFSAAKQIELPAGDGPELARRAALLRGEALEPWLDWRSERIAELYSRMRSELARERGSARLYLTAGELFTSRQLQVALRPTTAEDRDAGRLLRMLGLDAEALAKRNVILPRPHRVVPSFATAHDLQSHWNRAAGVDAALSQGIRSAAEHMLEPAPLPLPQFDAVSPFGADKTRTWLVAQLQPADSRCRQRFVSSLARLDAPLIIDGGWMLPLGQEDSLEHLVKVFRRLPAEAFTLVKPTAEAADAGTVVRTLKKAGRTYFYAVNDAPWPVDLELEFTAAERPAITAWAAERSPQVRHDGERTAWSVRLEPFDLVGGELDTEQVELTTYRAAPPAEAIDFLAKQVRDVRLAANALRSPPAKQVLSNPSFERDGDGGAIAGWVHAAGPGVTVEVDPLDGHRTSRSLHVVSRSNGAGPAPVVWVRSEPFAAPQSGRASLVAWIKVADANQQPKLRLAIEGKLDGKPDYRRANVGASEDGRPVKPLTTEFAPYRFPLTDLPLAGMTELRVGFDLMGEGEIWIDEVQVFDLWFEEQERDDLLKDIATADVQIAAGQLADGQRFLDGYWARFLTRHSPQAARRAMASAAAGGSNAGSERPGAVAHRATEGPPLPMPAASGGRKASKAEPSTWNRVKGWLPKWR
jgi:hypothetical protein